MSRGSCEEVPSFYFPSIFQTFYYVVTFTKRKNKKQASKKSKTTRQLRVDNFLSPKSPRDRVENNSVSIALGDDGNIV